MLPASSAHRLLSREIRPDVCRALEEDDVCALAQLLAGAPSVEEPVALFVNMQTVRRCPGAGAALCSRGLAPALTPHPPNLAAPSCARGQTALTIAAGCGAMRCVGYLAASGAQLTRRNGFFTPFLMATSVGDEAMMRLLLKLGADPTVPDAFGSSALAWLQRRIGDELSCGVLRRTVLSDFMLTEALVELALPHDPRARMIQSWICARHPTEEARRRERQQMAEVVHTWRDPRSRLGALPEELLATVFHAAFGWSLPLQELRQAAPGGGGRIAALLKGRGKRTRAQREAEAEEGEEEERQIAKNARDAGLWEDRMEEVRNALLF